MKTANVLQFKQAKEPSTDAPAGDYACQSEKATAVLTLDDNGTIRECNKAAAKLLDCEASKLTWHHISAIFPQLAETALMQSGIINPNLRFLSRIGYQFELVGLSGVHIACALFFNEVEDFGRHCLRLIIRPITPDYAQSFTMV